MTNAPWSFSIAATRQALDLDHLRVINDFTALALSLPVLTRADLQKIGGGSSAPNAPLGLLGPGPGLGVSALVPATSGGWTPIQAEGRPVTSAPPTQREFHFWWDTPHT